MPVSDDQNETNVERETSVKKPRPQFLPWFLVILLIAAIAWIGWRAYGPNRMGDPIGTTLVSFAKQNRLVVSHRKAVVDSQISKLSVGSVLKGV